MMNDEERKKVTARSRQQPEKMKTKRSKDRGGQAKTPYCTF
jgi:hypothetical protein